MLTGVSLSRMNSRLRRTNTSHLSLPPAPGWSGKASQGVFQSPCFCSAPTPTLARWAGDPRGTVQQERGLPQLPRLGLEEELVGYGGRQEAGEDRPG